MSLKDIIEILKELGIFKWIASLFSKKVPIEKIDKAYEDAKTTKDPTDISDNLNDSD